MGIVVYCGECRGVMGTGDVCFLSRPAHIIKVTPPSLLLVCVHTCYYLCVCARVVTH